ncbi:MAG: hypothetical protein JW927_19675 [Deltaproteobacteria bacterium]|nr:hypothetical protein [Deltaproteobacteria bacterium]
MDVPLYVPLYASKGTQGRGTGDDLKLRMSLGLFEHKAIKISGEGL